MDYLSPCPSFFDPMEEQCFLRDWDTGSCSPWENEQLLPGKMFGNNASQLMEEFTWFVLSTFAAQSKPSQGLADSALRNTLQATATQLQHLWTAFQWLVECAWGKGFVFRGLQSWKSILCAGPAPIGASIYK